MLFFQRDETLLSQAGISCDAVLNCGYTAGQILGVSPRISSAARDSPVTGYFPHVGVFTVNFPLRMRLYTTLCSRAAINLELINFIRPWGTKKLLEFCPSSSLLSGQPFPCAWAQDSVLSPISELSALSWLQSEALQEWKGITHFLNLLSLKVN